MAVRVNVDDKYEQHRLFYLITDNQSQSAFSISLYYIKESQYYDIVLKSIMSF